jgi:cell division protein FtsQ
VTVIGGPGTDVRPSPIVVDPRMRSRRMEVQRGAGRRRLRRVLIVAGTVGVLLAAYGITRSPLLDVDHVRVRGGDHTDEAAIARASGVGRGEPMVGLDLGAAARRVQSLPWVAEAQVERRWPGTVSIAVTERRPVAVAPLLGDRAALLDAAGRVLAVGTTPPPGLITVTGVRGRPVEGETVDRDARDALVVVEALGQRLPGVVTEVSIDLDATLAQGGHVTFGTTDDLDDKIVAVETVLADVDVSCLGVLDVRVAGSPVLTRNEGCS